MTPGFNCKIVADLFAAVRPQPPGDCWQFFWSREDPLGPLGYRAFTLYIDRAYLRHASSLLLRAYARHLDGMSMQNAEKLLLAFYRCHLIEFDKSFEIQLEPSTRVSTVVPPRLPQGVLATAATKVEEFVQSQIEERVSMALAAHTSIARDVDVGDCKILRPDGLARAVGGLLGHEFERLDVHQYPPIIGDHKEHTVGEADCWLVCISGTHEGALTKFARIKGALRMAADFPHSLQISMAEPPNGYTTFSRDGGCEQLTTEPSVPILAGGTAYDEEQVVRLQALLAATNLDKKGQRRLRIALQYAALGWTRNTLINFMNGAVSFDALFGSRRKVRESIVSGTAALLADFDRIKERMGFLLDIRNEVLHGDAASLESAGAYMNYYDTFDVDPCFDQARLFRAAMLRLVEQEP